MYEFETVYVLPHPYPSLASLKLGPVFTFSLRKVATLNLLRNDKEGTAT